MKKSQEYPKNWKAGTLLPYDMHRNKLIYFTGALSIVLTSICLVVMPRIVGEMIDVLRLEAKVPLWTSLDGYIKVLLVCFIIANVFLGFGRAAWRFFLGRSTHRVNRWLRGVLWEKACKFPKKRLDERYTVGFLMNASTSDVKTASFLFGFTLIGLFDSLFLGLFTLISMFLLNIKMAFLTLSISLFLPYFIRKLSKIETIRYKFAQNFLGKLNEECTQAISTIRLQRVTGTSSFWKDRLSISADKYRGKRLRAVFTSLAFFPLFGLSVVVSYVILFAVGIFEIQNGNLTVGGFVAMQGLIFLMQDPLMEFGFVISEIQKSRASLDRLNGVFSESLDQGLVGKGCLVEENESDLFKLEGLHFSYDENVKVIDSLTMNVAKGERVGIMGKVGSGKSSLVKIMSGLEQNFGGKVLLYGKDIRSYQHESLRENIKLVSQKNFLFSDTVRYNVSLNQTLSDGELWHFLEVAGMADEINKLDKGLDTALGEWGVNLSGGQKQRLTLARALAAKPNVLFLDDCLSAVDTVTENKILASLNRELKGKSVIWVAHRESTLKYCDKVLELS